MKILHRIFACIPAAILAALIFGLNPRSAVMLFLVALLFYRVNSARNINEYDIINTPPILRTKWFKFQSKVFGVLAVLTIIYLLLAKQWALLALAAVTSILCGKILDIPCAILIIFPVGFLVDKTGGED